MNPDISIIIVNYNSKGLLYRSLESIYKCLQTIKYEVIVVDNGSIDDSIALCADFREYDNYYFILQKENLGFARGCNIGAEIAKGEILHFLNPDTELNIGMEGDYKEVFAAMDKIYVNRLINKDGSVENEKMVLPLLRDIFWWNVDREKARFWCRGASVIISKGNFLKVGKWSEDYFMYGEDLDLFYSFWIKGLKIKFLSTPILHYGGGCSENVWTSFEREVMVQKSFKIFFEKHFSKWQYIAVKLYFLAHNLIKHPSKIKSDIKAWKKV